LSSLSAFMACPPPSFAAFPRAVLPPFWALFRPGDQGPVLLLFSDPGEIFYPTPFSNRESQFSFFFSGDRPVFLFDCVVVAPTHHVEDCFLLLFLSNGGAVLSWSPSPFPIRPLSFPVPLFFSPGLTNSPLDGLIWRRRPQGRDFFPVLFPVFFFGQGLLFYR